MATKKSGGSSKNGRTSNPHYRGVKKFGGEFVRAGNILVRQTGSSFNAGLNVQKGKDFTLFATKDGIVEFYQGWKKRQYIKINTEIKN